MSKSRRAQMAELESRHSREWEEFVVSLPPPPKTHRCKRTVMSGGKEYVIQGGMDTIKLIEPGYERFSRIEPSDLGDYWHASTNGWSDMSEHGIVEYLCCTECFRAWAAPDVEWD